MSNSNDGFRLTGRHVLFGFIAFFAVVIVTDIVFVRLAVSSFPGEEVEKSYYQGLNYNETLEEKRRQTEAGWRMQLVTLPEPGEEAQVEVRLLAPDGSPARLAEVTGEIVRPTTERGRQVLSFAPAGDGLYRATLEGIEEGAWDLSLAASSAAGETDVITARTRIVIE
jgi:nitrogen fixation protein FixH